MFAESLIWDEFEQGDIEEKIVDHTQVLERISALNGETKTILTISGEGSHPYSGRRCQVRFDRFRRAG